MAIQTDEEVSVALAAVKEAERCHREASAMISKDPVRFADLVGQPSGWCVVTEKGFWSRSFHSRHEESLLRERLEHGHKVILTVGIVADPRVSVTPQNHVAAVHVDDSFKLRSEKLAVITAHAKIHAASARYR